MNSNMDKSYQAIERKRSVLSVAAKVSYPKAVVFILISKFFESFAANGVRTILALFLRDFVSISEDLATEILHIFNFISQFTPLAGAIIADSVLGNARTIFILFILYGLGYSSICIITLPFFTVFIKWAACVALLLISLGNGGIRACVASLGAEQFVLPVQQKELGLYFSRYYIFYTSGIMLSKIIPPMIRAKFQCFGESECYFMVFGAIGGSFLLSWAVFLCGFPFFKSTNSSAKNSIVKVLGCVNRALYNKLRHCIKAQTSTSETRGVNYWLEYAKDQYSTEFITDVQYFIRVLYLFLPLPMYWALTAQQDSTWTFQASQLNTIIWGFYIEPDQVKVLGPVILLVNIWVFDKALYPILQSYGFLRKPLQKLGTGAAMAAIAFMCAGFLQQKIEHESSFPEIGKSNLNILNYADFNITYQTSLDIISKSNVENFKDIPMEAFHQSVKINVVSGETNNDDIKVFFINLFKDQITTCIFTVTDNNSIGIIQLPSISKYERPPSQHFKIRVLFASQNFNASSSNILELHNLKTHTHTIFNKTATKPYTVFEKLKAGRYEIRLHNSRATKLTKYLLLSTEEFEIGGLYTLVLTDVQWMQGGINQIIFSEVTPHKISVTWQIPQFFLLMLGEVLLSIPGLQFAFTQEQSMEQVQTPTEFRSCFPIFLSMNPFDPIPKFLMKEHRNLNNKAGYIYPKNAPDNMKSVLVAVWFVNNAIGNLIVVIITEINLLQLQSEEFFLYAVLMTISTIIFVILSIQYKYV